VKCIIAGSRTITDYKLVVRAFFLSGFASKVTEIVSGHAARTQVNGVWKDNVDRLGEKLSVEFGLGLKVMPADWDKFGLKAGHERNWRMAEYVAPRGGLIAVWDGKSNGTYDMITIAKAFQLKQYVYEVQA